MPNSMPPKSFSLDTAKSSSGANIGSPPSKKVGLIAGWGNFPIQVAEAMVESGYEIYCIAVKGHADPKLKQICHHHREYGMGKMGAQGRWLRREGVTQATLAGKIFKTIIFEKFALLKHLPDMAFIRHFWPVYVTRKSDRRDDTLLTIVTQLYSSYGVTFEPATDFAPEILVKPGFHTHRKPTSAEQQDIQFGWEMAKEMGRLDIGQSIVVKDQAVLAVEAIEGTDACIRRAGELCKKGGFTVVKVAKPQQDMRFDVPTIGVGTIETIHKAGGKILAIEAEKTIILEQDATIARADQLGIAIVAINSPQELKMLKSA